jgi:hypothetical protein
MWTRKRFQPPRPRAVVGALVILAVGLLRIGLGVGCLTTPPSGLAPTLEPPPTVLHDALIPPDDQLLSQWPLDNMFIIPVRLEGPNQHFAVDVFIDDDGSHRALPVWIGTGGGQSGIDGGVVLMPIALQPPPPTTAACHRIEVFVVDGFATSEAGATLYGQPDSIGGDSVVWFYTPTGGLDGCETQDSGPDGPSGAAAVEDDGGDR